MSFLTDPKDYTFLAEVEHEGRTFKKYRNEAEGYDLWWISDQEVWYENEALFHTLNSMIVSREPGRPAAMKNAIITSARIEIEDHGILTCWIQLDYGGSGQGFGGWTLHLPHDFKHYQQNGPAGEWIMRILQVAGVTSWADLPGKTIRVQHTDQMIKAIGHIINDDWFTPITDLQEWKEKE